MRLLLATFQNIFILIYTLNYWIYPNGFLIIKFNLKNLFFVVFFFVTKQLIEFSLTECKINERKKVIIKKFKSVNKSFFFFFKLTTGEC